MSSIDIPANKNFLSPLGFRFVLNRAPNLNFNVQSVSIPGMSLTYTETATPFVPISNSGKIVHNNLGITFRVSEDLDDYLELHNWMYGLGFPNNFDEYKSLQNSTNKTYSDITVLIMNSALRSNLRATFLGAFPIQLGDLNFNTTDTDVNYIECSAEFKFTSFEIALEG